MYKAPSLSESRESLANSFRGIQLFVNVCIGTSIYVYKNLFQATMWADLEDSVCRVLLAYMLSMSL